MLLVPRIGADACPEGPAFCAAGREAERDVRDALDATIQAARISSKALKQRVQALEAKRHDTYVPS
jgi:hypothetical protein